MARPSCNGCSAKPSLDRSARTILLTRPQPHLERTARVLEQAGHAVLRLPLLQIVPPTRAPSAKQRQWLAQAQWLIFTSQFAVDGAEGLLPPPPKARIAAVGAATAARLRQAGWPLHWQAPGNDTASLLDAPDAPDWAGRIAIMAGRGGRRRLKTELQTRGCDVAKLLLYQRQASTVSAEQLRQAIAATPIALFSSGFALRRWQELVHKHQLQSGLKIDLLVASTRLCKLASQLGFVGHIQALPKMSDEALLTALNEWKHV